MSTRHLSFSSSFIVLLTVAVLVALPGVALAAPAEQEQAPAAEPTAAPAEDQAPAADQALETANTLRWTTASEVDNFGFDIYRATTEEGPFERLTKDPIPGAGTTDEPQSYVYVDDTNDPSQGYYYYIESISMAGVREKFSPVAYIKPKRPAS